MSNLIKACSIFTIQVIIIICYGLFTTYDVEVNASNSVTTNSLSKDTVLSYYPFFQDVHVMIFIGFGFLMTFLRRYAYSSLGYTFYLSAFCVQISILINGFFHCLLKNKWNTIELDITSLITGDFSAGAVLISMGALLGKTSINQMITMAFFEIIFYSINESIGVQIYEAVDMGGSMYVHMFGAYFGLAVSFVLSSYDKPLKNSKNSSNYNSDMTHLGM